MYLLLIVFTIGRLQRFLQEVQAQFVDWWFEEVIFHQAEREGKNKLQKHTLQKKKYLFFHLSLSSPVLLNDFHKVHVALLSEPFAAERN